MLTIDASTKSRNATAARRARTSLPRRAARKDAWGASEAIWEPPSEKSFRGENHLYHKLLSGRMECATYHSHGDATLRRRSGHATPRRRSGHGVRRPALLPPLARVARACGERARDDRSEPGAVRAAERDRRARGRDPAGAGRRHGRRPEHDGLADRRA